MQVKAPCLTSIMLSGPLSAKADFTGAQQGSVSFKCTSSNAAPYPRDERATAPGAVNHVRNLCCGIAPAMPAEEDLGPAGRLHIIADLPPGLSGNCAPLISAVETVALRVGSAMLPCAAVLLHVAML